jgi:putative PIN family toxin of toxin-antitoxin system
MAGINLVLDTNVFVTYARYGRLQNLVQCVLYHQLNLLVDGTLLAEIDDVLRRPGVLKADVITAGDVVPFIREFTIRVVTRTAYTLSPDPEDNYLFDIALQYKALVIVTDEKALLNFGPHRLLSGRCNGLKRIFPDRYEAMPAPVFPGAVR